MGEFKLGGEQDWKWKKAWWERPQALPLSDTRATKLFKDALSVPAGRARFSAALCNLGQMHEMGRHGGPPDEDRALELYRRGVGFAKSAVHDGDDGEVEDERAMSNVRAVPSHIHNVASSGLGWEELVESISHKLSVSLGLPDRR